MAAPELVLVPLWRRPGFAWACLHRLLAVDSPELTYRMLLDYGFDREVLAVVDSFREKVGADRVEITYRYEHPMRGNSVNILSGYAQACLGDWSLVHLVEEDVLVADGYFDYHRQAHALVPDAFAVSACRNHNAPAPAGLGLDEVWTHPSYQSLGISFRPEVLQTVLPHIAEKYFKDPVGYCRRHFPRSAIPAPHAEQDGLLNRLREKAGEKTVYPGVPRAYHAGFDGYNRQGLAELVGTAEEQGRNLLAMSSDDLNKRAHSSFRDHEVVPLSGPVHPVTRSF